jgi:uncharacterized protein YbjT (DUF2867 family)
MDSSFQANKANKVILVTGATGNQGGAVATRLVSSGWRVRALVRDADKPASRFLSWKGVELIEGDLDAPLSVGRAMRGAYGVFCVLSWREGIEKEIKQGRNIVDTAKAYGVKHFIYSSVGGAERSTGIPHFDSKWQIERYLYGSGVPSTVFRPVYMMYNFNRPETRSSILKGALTMNIKPDRPLQMLAAEDLAVFIGLALEKPSDFMGKAIELAGDELTMPQAAEVFSRVLGLPVRFIERPISEAYSVSKESALMMEWFNRHGYRADIRALHVLHPGMMTLEIWLRKAGEWAKAA